jgi:hypothetical protein
MVLAPEPDHEERRAEELQALPAARSPGRGLTESAIIFLEDGAVCAVVAAGTMPDWLFERLVTSRQSQKTAELQTRTTKQDKN